MRKMRCPMVVVWRFDMIRFKECLDKTDSYLLNEWDYLENISYEEEKDGKSLVKKLIALSMNYQKKD